METIKEAGNSLAQGSGVAVGLPPDNSTGVAG